MQSHYRTGLHERYEDDYKHEDYDGYEEEGSEEEEEDEKEKSVTSKEQEAFLSLREQLKQKFRQNKKPSASVDKKKMTSSGSFGSFFGPSHPVIASRVLDESRAIRETNYITSRVSSSSSGSSKCTLSTSSVKKAHVQYQQPKAINEVKKKAQTLKDMRDYSFLLSDDADFPATDKEEQWQPAAWKPVRNSDGCSAQASSKFKPPMGKPARPVSNGDESKNAVSKNLQSQTRVGLVKGAGMGRPRPASAEPRKVCVISTNGRPIGHKPLPSKMSATAMGTNRPPAKVMSDLSLKKKVPSALPHSSTQKNHYLEQKGPSERLNKVTPAPKQQLPSSKAQMKPSEQIALRGGRENRLKKQPVKRRFDEEDDEDAIQMIRNMFGYNPNRYVGADEDVSDMEADFSQILKEERRSSKIAKKEDEEQLRLIEEEERQERMRKKQKLIRR